MATQQFGFNECAYNEVMEKDNGGYLNFLAEQLLGVAISYMLRYKSALFQDKANEMIVMKWQRYDAKAKKLVEARGLNAVMARNA